MTDYVGPDGPGKADIGPPRSGDLRIFVLDQSFGIPEGMSAITTMCWGYDARSGEAPHTVDTAKGASVCLDRRYVRWLLKHGGIVKAGYLPIYCWRCAYGRYRDAFRYTPGKPRALN